MDLHTCRYGHPSHLISGITSGKDGNEIRRYGHWDWEWDDFHARWNAVHGQESFYWCECGVTRKMNFLMSTLTDVSGGHFNDTD